MYFPQSDLLQHSVASSNLLVWVAIANLLKIVIESPVADVVHEQPGLDVEVRPRPLVQPSGVAFHLDPQGRHGRVIMGVGYGDEM